MRKGWILTIAAAALAAGAGLPAHAGGFGVGANVALPTGDFGDVLDSGFGIHALARHPVAPLVTLTGDAGWTTFSTQDLTTDVGGYSFELGGDNVDIWNFTAGARVALMPMGLGLEYGYFSEVDEWSLVPNAGVSFSKLAVDLRYKATGDANWFELRAGIYF